MRSLNQVLETDRNTAILLCRINLCILVVLNSCCNPFLEEKRWFWYDCFKTQPFECKMYLIHFGTFWETVDFTWKNSMNCRVHCRALSLSKFETEHFPGGKFSSLYGGGIGGSLPCDSFFAVWCFLWEESNFFPFFFPKRGHGIMVDWRVTSCVSENRFSSSLFWLCVRFARLLLYSLWNGCPAPRLFWGASGWMQDDSCSRRKDDSFDSWKAAIVYVGWRCSRFHWRIGIVL